MKRLLKRHLHFWARWFWGTALFLVITLAVVVQLGKALFPVLNDYRGDMEAQLSTQLGVNVSVADISADWTGLRPRVTFSGVAVHNLAQKSVFRVEEVSAEVSLLSTLRDWRLGFRKVVFNGLEATLAQNDQGGWWVDGLKRGPPRPSEEDDARFTDPVDIFLFGRRVELRNTGLTLLFRDGLSTALAIPYVRLENDAQFHRLTASFAVDEEQQALDLVVEGKGDPRDDANFDARGYLRLQRFPAEKVLAALGVRDTLWPGEAGSPTDRHWREDGKVTLSLWFQGSSTRGVTWNGEVVVDGSPVQAPDGVQWPAALQSGFSGAWEPQRGWQLSAAGARLTWPEFSAPPLDLQLHGRFGGDTELAVASVDLASWSEVAQRAGLLRGQAAEVLADLQPQGELRNVHLVRRPAEQGYFSLRGNLIQASASAWQGVPALEGVSGYVQASAYGGEIRLLSETGFSMHFPLIYHQPLAFQHAEGTVRWEIDLDARKVYIGSGLVQLANEAVAARGHFNVHAPLEAGGEPEMTLVVGVAKGAADLHRTLVPFTAPAPLLAWLDRAVRGGDVSRAGFIYHGSLAKEATVARVIQLRGQVTDAELAFDPAWPTLQRGAGLLYLDDHNLTVTDLSGALEQVDVTNGRVDIVSVGADQHAIRVRAAAGADSGEAVSLLARTPVGEMLGNELMGWQWRGPLTADLDVQVPLGGDQSAAYQKINLEFAANHLHMPGLGLTLEEVAGPLTYDSAQGLSSPAIKARLWGKTMRAVLSTQESASGREVVAQLRGKVDVADVRTWAQRPELAFARGTSLVTGELRVPLAGDAPLRLALTSSLEGVELMAPPPINKLAPQQLPLQVLMESRRTDQHTSSYRYSFTLADTAELRLAMQDGRVHAADLTFMQEPEPLQEGIFRVDGRVDYADALVWRDVLERYLSLTAASESANGQPGKPNEDFLPFRVDLDIGELRAGDLLLEQAHLRASDAQGTWHVALEHPTFAGAAIWSPGDTPLQLQLDRLHLPEQKTEEPVPVEGDGIALTGDPFVPENGDFWLSLDLAGIPAADVSIADLRRGDTELGRWAFKVRPIERGLLIYDLTAESVGLSIGGRDKPGAELVWTRTPNGDNSYFSGLVRAGNLADTFRRLALEPALSSDNAKFDVELQWAAPPAGINLLTLAGVVDLSVQRGVFSRGGGVGDNPLLKLIGLLNFDTLARRLRLDFSDLGASGLAYEEINGSLLFRRGTVHIQQPLQVDTPSSHLQLVGELDVAQETLDTQLVATLPLAGNLTVAAAVTGGVPLAIGVYVVGKIFKNQVDRVSSLRYKVTGSWNDPDTKLERIFENTVADPAPRSIGTEGGPREP